MIAWERNCATRGNNDTECFNENARRRQLLQRLLYKQGVWNHRSCDTFPPDNTDIGTSVSLGKGEQEVLQYFQGQMVVRRYLTLLVVYDASVVQNNGCHASQLHHYAIATKTDFQRTHFIGWRVKCNKTFGGCRRRVR